MNRGQHEDNFTLDDLVQEGLLEVVRMVREDDLDAIDCFPAYARITMHSAMYRLANADDPIPFERTVKQHFYTALDDAREAGEAPCMANLKLRLRHVSDHMIWIMIQVYRRSWVYLDAMPFDDGDEPNEAFVTDQPDGHRPVEARVERRDFCAAIRRMIVDRYNVRHWEAFALHFGLDGRGAYTSQEIADYLGVSRASVYAMQRRARKLLAGTLTPPRQHTRPAPKTLDTRVDASTRSNGKDAGPQMRLIAPETQGFNPEGPQVRTNKTGWRGVSFAPRGWFRARCWMPGGKVRNLGCFEYAEEAALAYNAATREVFGDDAILNDVPADWRAKYGEAAA
jgi:RNA polymerase sigma factor (sigma-70 family)